MSSRFLAAVVVVGGIAACAPATHLTAVWKDSSVTAPVHFNKVLVAAQIQDQARRRNMENYLAAKIPNSTPSYRVLNDDDTKNADGARAKVMAGGFDGAIVVRFVGTSTQTTYVPGTTYWGPAPLRKFWGLLGLWLGRRLQPRLPADRLGRDARVERVRPQEGRAHLVQPERHDQPGLD